MAKIMRFGVLKMSGLMGIYGAFIGLIFGILFLLLSSLLPAGTENIIPGGFLGIILYPLFYSVSGFVGGIILTPIINLSLRIIKGLDLDLETGSPQRMETHSQTPAQHHQGYGGQAQRTYKESSY